MVSPTEPIGPDGGGSPDVADPVVFAEVDRRSDPAEFEPGAEPAVVVPGGPPAAFCDS